VNNAPMARHRGRRILGMGYVVLDILQYDGMISHMAGGTTGNILANLQFLGWDSEAASLIGTDAAGTHLLADLERAGVGVGLVDARPDVVTPVVVYEVVNGSHRFRFSCPQCGRRFSRYRPLHQGFVEARLTAAPDVLFFDRVSAASLSVAEETRSKGGLVVFEPSTRGRTDGFVRALELCHIVKCSDQRMTEFRTLLDKAPDTQVQVVTRGREGVSWRLRKTTWRDLPAFSARVIDDGGAGDWMTAGFLAALPSLDPEALGEEEIASSLQMGQALAALSCAWPGARGMSANRSRRQVLTAARALMQDSRRDRSIERIPAMKAQRPYVDGCVACLVE
jgi:fructokinase